MFCPTWLMSCPESRSVRRRTLQLAAVYYDTPTLSLARWGVTLRSRSGEAGPSWTLKVPITSSDSELSRHEFVFDEPTGAVPPAVSRATRAYVRSQTLGPVVRLQTDRTQYVVELDGRPLATVCDDMVLADSDAEPISVFREIEIELIDTPSAICRRRGHLATSQRRLQGRRGSCAQGSTSTGTAGVRPTGRHHPESRQACELSGCSYATRWPSR